MDFFCMFEFVRLKSEYKKLELDHMCRKDIFPGLILSLLGGITVIIGAVGAHQFRPKISIEAYDRFETGFFYQVFHLLVLLLVWSSDKISSRSKTWIYRFMGLGILFFSGSLYLVAIRELLVFDLLFLSYIAPFGGLLFISGWLTLAWGIYKKREDKVG